MRCSTNAAECSVPDLQETAGLQPAQCGGFDLGMLEGLAGKWVD
jgi:hypothetical protein